MKDLIKKQDKKFEGTIHAILAGLLLNGFIQGQENEKLNDRPLDFAKKEFNKIIKKVRKETAEAVCDKMIGEERDEIFKDDGKHLRIWSDGHQGGWNKRVREEKQIKKQIIKKL